MPKTWVTDYSGRHRYHFWPERILKLLHPAFRIIEVAQIIVHEGDEPYAIGHMLDADILAGKDLTEIDLAAVQTMRPQVVTVIVLS